MSLNSISGQFRNSILNLNLQAPPDIVTGLVNLTSSVTVNAYLNSLGQDALIHFYNVQNPGDVETDGAAARILNLNKTNSTPADITAGITDLTPSAAYASNLLAGRGQLTNIGDLPNANPGDVVTDAVSPRNTDLAKNLNTPTDITAGITDLTPNTLLAAQYLSGRGSFTVVNDFNVINPGDVLTDAVLPRNLDFAKNLNTPTDITAGITDLTPNALLAAQYLGGRGSFSVINDFNVINPGDVLTDAVAPRNLDLSHTLNTPTDITAGVTDLTATAALAAQYLSGRGSFTVINDFVNVNPGDVINDAIVPRASNFALTLNTPADITAGINNLTPSAIIASQYLSGKGAFTAINVLANVNPGDVLTDAVTPRAQNFAQTLATPVDITAGINNLSGAFAAQYLSGKGAFTVINNYSNINPGDVVTDALVPRAQNLAKTLATPVDITAGVTNLSGSFAAQYLSGRGTDTVINDFNNVNPGDVVTDSFAPRTLDLNKNLNTPADIAAGITALTATGAIAAQYLGGRGLDSIINDFSVINPGDVLTDALAPRFLNFSRTLNTPADIAAGITALTASGAIAAQYLSGRGFQTFINDFVNTNPGDVKTIGGPALISLFNLNMAKDPTDETDIFTSSQMSSVGQDTILNSYTILNQAQLSPLQKPYADNVALNRYNTNQGPLVYENLEKFTLNQTPNTPQNPYIVEGKLSNADIPDDALSLGDLINIPTASTPLSALLGSDLDISNLLTSPGNKNDTLLAQIGAVELRFSLNARIATKIAQEAASATTLDDMVTNPLKIVEFLKNPSSIIEKAGGDITTFKGGLGKLASFLSDLSGLGGLTSAFFTDDSETLIPSCFGKKLKDKSPDRILETGRGQRYSLFSNLGNNKYSPGYINRLNTDNYNLFRKLKNPDNVEQRASYLNNKDGLYLLQNEDGLQIKSNAELTKVMRFDAISGTENYYDEPGVEDVSKYGSKQTEFVWRGTTTEHFLNPIARTSTSDNWDSKIKNSNTSLSKNKVFRDCSILDITQRLIDEGDRGSVALLSIDQTKTKFSDGYNFYAKGSGVITPYRVERKNKNGETIGYKYLVPGLDAGGRRDDKRMYNEVELCRTWTKAKPFSKITDLVRWKELNRKERNSVLDRYGNLNIHPSALNVNEGYGRLGDGLGDAVVEAFGEKRARKYMFSIENLAWKDSSQFNELPPCEKGPNGGRIMWFPPYELRFQDDVTTNWTTHQFLGRPEPIYTYNNTERTGTLNWSIVVDHPTIMNLLVDKEMAALTDGEVDELLAAFWAGCLEYDIFELARIWGVFTDSDIEYFKKVIGDLDIRLPNTKIREKVQSSGSSQERTVKIETQKKEAPTRPKVNLFFENDVPLGASRYTKKPTDFNVKSYEDYYGVYSNLAKGQNLNQNVEYVANQIGGEALTYAEYIHYENTLGDIHTDSKLNIFFNKESVSDAYGYELNFNKLSGAFIPLSETEDYDITISMSAFASPSAPGQSQAQIQKYNDKLASRRFVSVVKFLLLKTLTDNKDNNISLFDVNDSLITESTVDQIFGTTKESFETVKNIVVYRKNSKKPDVKQKIIFNITTAKGLTVNDVFSTSSEFPKLFGGIKTVTVGTETVQYYDGTVYRDPATNKNVNYYILKTLDDFDKVKDNFKVDGVLIPNNRIGVLVCGKTQKDGSFKLSNPARFADVVAGNLSPLASYCRRVEISTTFQERNIEIVRKEPPAETPPQYIEEKSTTTNVTKREIAQRVLNKLLTECDYFEYLSKETPIVYESLKQKLKYFSPAFHAMTPEGLNARLTFLQQCMRPGDTITKTTGTGVPGCDARNTAFGRPPISVLRIGDFYHTKIVINSMHITYDPLLFDLNPEGIGVQPMLAKVSLSFKYIGGQGLRKYVDQLQNALTFNYYGNTDVYDERTFANTDRRERDLINLEQDFFAQNTLDLVPIVAQAELITPDNNLIPFPVGTIGVISNRLLPKLAGGTYYNYLNASETFNPTKNYTPESSVLYNGQYYVRKIAEYKIDGSGSPILADPTDTTLWTALDQQNFGEWAYRQEYGRTYIQQYDIKYYDLFNELYKTFGEYVRALVDVRDKTTATDTYRVISDILRNKNYSTPIQQVSATVGASTTSGTSGTSGSAGSAGTAGTTNVIDNIISSIENAITPLDVNAFYGATYSEIFNNASTSKRYLEVGDVFTKHKFFLNKNNNKPEQFEALKLNLNPQNYMFKIGDNFGIPYNFAPLSGVTNNGRSSKYFAGNFTNGYTNNFKGLSETGGIYFKDATNTHAIYTSILDNFANEFKTKISLNLLPIWDLESNLSTFNDFYSKLESSHRRVFKNYLNELFDSYYDKLLTSNEESSNAISDRVAKMSVIIAGLSLPLYGYDAKYQDGGKASIYEIVPNAKKLVTPVTDTKMFGYNPYESYKKLNITGGDIISLDSVDKIFADNNGGGGTTIDEYTSLGNGLYFFKQLAPTTGGTNNVTKEYKRNMSVIANYFGITDVTKLPSQFDFNNFLPTSLAFNGSTLSGSTTNFNFDTKYSFNPFEFGANSRSLETTADNLIIRNNNGSTSTPSPNVYSQGKYEMQYVYEKLNYEMLDFSNKTLDLMFSDLLETKVSDLDLTYTPSLEFNTQVDNLSTITITTNPLFPFLGKKETLFYNGDNLLSANPFFTNINFYKFKVDDSLTSSTTLNGVSGSDFIAILTNLNKNIEYNFNINSDYIKSLNSLSTITVNNGPSTISKIKLSAMHELIFLDFIYDLSANKAKYIDVLTNNRFKDEFITIPANLQDKPNKQKSLIEKKKKDIQKTITKVFDLFGMFVSKNDTDILNMYSYIDSIKTENIKLINKNVFGKEEADTLDKATVIASSLMKGTADDYTLTFRETSKLDNTIIRNLKLFTKYKNESIINISGQTEAANEPTVQTVTQLAQLYPELYG